MVKSKILGFKEAFKVLDALPKALNRNTINGAAGKAGLIVKREARQILIDEATDEGFFSWSRFIAKGVVVRRHKSSSPPGAAVLVDGPDVPLSGRFFTLWKAARIWAFGAFNTPDRKGHGRFEGFGDFMKEAATRKDAEIRATFLSSIIPQMQKSGNNLMRRLGRHGR